MPEVSDLTGFREDTLDIAFEQPARLTFTLEGVRSDDTPLDTEAQWTYTVNGVTHITGYLRILQERLSPTEDFQRYTLTDRWMDVARELLLLDGSARFTLNPDTGFADDGSSAQNTLGELIELIADQSAILSGSPKVVWPAAAPSDQVERNIEVEGRGIAEMIVDLLVYNPDYRLYLNSGTSQLIFKDISSPTSKKVILNKAHTSWADRTPNFSDVCDIDLQSDKTDCYEKVYLEGFGAFEQVTVDLEQAWNCASTPPYMPEHFRDDPCMEEDFARLYALPEGIVPAEFSFDETGRASPNQMIRLEAYRPRRNTGQCVTSDDDPDIGRFDEARCTERWELGSGNEWQWTDYQWVSVGEVEVPPADENGRRYIRMQDRMMSMLNVWSPNAYEVHVGNGPILADTPRIEAWEMRATLWQKTGNLIAEKDGGCSNGTTYPRVNTDWAQVTIVDSEGNSSVVRDDSTQMENMRDKLFDQVSRPKTSGSVTIYLHLVDPTATLEGAIKTNPIGGVNLGNVVNLWSLGDGLNIEYDATETLGKGTIPDYNGIGADVDWDALNIVIMGIHYNRIKQTLKLDVANTPYIIGDRLAEGLQR